MKLRLDWDERLECTAQPSILHAISSRIYRPRDTNSSTDTDIETNTKTVRLIDATIDRQLHRQTDRQTDL